MAQRRRVGIVSVPFSGVPPRQLGSVSYVVDQIVRRATADCEFTVISGDYDRAAEREHPDVEYHGWGSRVDRWWSDRRAQAQEPDRHRFHRASFHPAFARRAAKVFAARRCEVVFATVFPQWLPILRDRLPQAKLVLWAHDATFAEDSAGQLGHVAFADGVIGCSQATADRYAAAVPALTNRCWAVHNGVDLDVFFPDQRSRDTAHFAFVGRRTPEKGPHVLVDAVAALQPRFGQIRASLVGPDWVSDPAMLLGTDPAHLREINALCSTHYSAELERRAGAADVTLHGPRDRPALAELYRSITALVHPALWEEPFGMPVLEAMACGAPVVVSRRGGLPEFVDEDDCLVRSGNVGELAEALAQLIDEPERARALSVAAATTARERFTWECSARAFVRAVERVLTPA